MKNISREEKEKYLLSLSEAHFRDAIVRRVFCRLGLKDGRDLCGPEEHGKDAIFYEIDALGEKNLIAVQTKIGNINLAAKATTNLMDQIAQLKTALATPFVCVATKAKIFPSKVYLVASGRINEAARERVLDSINDNRIKFFDRDDLIAKVDESCPEIWYNIVTELSPYLKALSKRVEEHSVLPADANVVFGAQGGYIAAADQAFVEVRLVRPSMTRRQERGKWKTEFDFEEIKGTSLPKIKGAKVLVLGEAGTGKSTLLVRLAYLMAREGIRSNKDYRVPVPVRAKEIAESESLELLDVCIRSIKTQTGIDHIPFSTDDLDAGRVVLLVDALDEVVGIDSRSYVVKSLLEFHSRFPKTSVIVTTRAYGSIEHIKGTEAFERYRMSAISLADAKQIVDRVQHKSSDSLKTQELLRRLDSVHGMQLNPLLVTVFALIAGADKRDLPANITELFSKFTELMLGRWDEKKGLALQYQARMKEYLLSKFSFQLHENKRTTFSVDEFRNFAKGALDSINQSGDLEVVVRETLERSGLFRGEDDSLEFRHHLLQEFFAAKGISDCQYIKNVVGNDWWRNPIVFYFGNNPADVNQLLDVATSGVVSSEANITIGLALQTCYLSRLEDRIEVWKLVVETAAYETSKSIAGSAGEKYPLSNFIMDYICKRDSVAMMGIEKPASGVIEWAENGNGFASGDPEFRRFWLLAGLVELGHTATVRQSLTDHPLKENRLNLALHLGCHMVQKVRAVSAEAKADAEGICKDLASRVAFFQGEIIKEFQGQILELQKGKVVALDESEPETIA